LKTEVFGFSGAVAPPCWAGSRRADVQATRRRRWRSSSVLHFPEKN